MGRDRGLLLQQFRRAGSRNHRDRLRLGIAEGDSGVRASYVRLNLLFLRAEDERAVLHIRMNMRRAHRRVRGTILDCLLESVFLPWT